MGASCYICFWRHIRLAPVACERWESALELLYGSTTISLILGHSETSESKKS